MDDHTEVPPEPKFRVRYQDEALPGPSYTRPLTHQQALVRKTMLDSTEGISGAEVLEEGVIAGEKAQTFRVEGDAEHRQMLEQAQDYASAAKEQVREDLDASLEDDDTFAEELEETLKQDAAVLDSWSHKQNRHTALDHAMKLATMPLGGMSVQVSGPTPEHVIETARKFLAFLNEEGTGA